MSGIPTVLARSGVRKDVFNWPLLSLHQLIGVHSSCATYMLRCDLVYHEFPVCDLGKQTLHRISLFPIITVCLRLLVAPSLCMCREAVARISTVVTDGSHFLVAL